MKTIKFNEEFIPLIKSGNKTCTIRPTKGLPAKYYCGEIVLIKGTDISLKIISSQQKHLDYYARDFRIQIRRANMLELEQPKVL